MGIRAWQTEHDMKSEMCPQEGVTSRGNENETLRELNLLLTGGRLSPTGRRSCEVCEVLDGGS